jgi:hypothetical protein
VFSRDGGEVHGWYYDGWETACRKAGLVGRLFHDLRRSAVRNLVRAGVSETVAMTLSGHLTPSVFRRYNITSSADQVEAVRKLAAFQGEIAPERLAAAVGSFSSTRTRTIPAQSGDSTGTSHRQRLGITQRGVASPMSADSNRLFVWLRRLDALRRELSRAA